jgi:hypothetical protein
MTRLTIVHDLVAANLVVGSASEKRKRGRRAPNLVSVAKQAARVGLTVARYEVEPETGKISVVTGKPDIDTNGNPWLAELGTKQ